MTRNQIRHTAYKALDAIEWMDKHATARQPKDARQLEFKLKDLRKGMLKLIDTYIRDADLEKANTEPD